MHIESEGTTMMRPMKIAGDQLVFGNGCLEHLKTLKGNKAMIVTGGSSMKKAGILDKVQEYLKEAGIESVVYGGIKHDPTFHTVLDGASKMLEEKPDLIIALGGGSVMDGAKAMWVTYEHPEIDTLEKMAPPNKIPKLRNKAKFVCIPTTSGTASEVSRSVVITDDETGFKFGIGDMEMMPDVAICDPCVTLSLPAKLTAETGMDALTHALEAFVSKRANYLSDILAKQAAKDIVTYLPLAVADGSNMEYRDKMMNGSMVAGLAFTNVSLGITHSIAHTLGSYYRIQHGLADAIVLPYIIQFNSKDETARKKYEELGLCNGELDQAILELNKKIGIASSVGELILDKEEYMAKIPEMAKHALADGCTKTNPIIPTVDEMEELFRKIYTAL